MNQLPFDETSADDSKPTPNPSTLPSSLPELLTIRELAKTLKLSPRSIWRLVRNRQLPSPIRIGGSIRWRVADVSSWINDAASPQKKPDDVVGESTDDEERRGK